MNPNEAMPQRCNHVTQAVKAPNKPTSVVCPPPSLPPPPTNQPVQTFYVYYFAFIVAVLVGACSLYIPLRPENDRNLAASQAQEINTFHVVSQGL